MAGAALPMRASLEAVRGRARLASALVLLAFVVCHLAAHGVLLV